MNNTEELIEAVTPITYGEYVVLTDEGEETELTKLADLQFTGSGETHTIEEWDMLIEELEE